MRTIHKYMIPLREIATVSVHSGAHLLHVGMQDGSLFSWFMVDTERELEDRTFVIVGTGAEIPDDLGMDEFIATVMDGWHGAGPGGNGYVWHLFETGRLGS